MHAELEELICSRPRRGKQQTYALLDHRVPASPLDDLSREQALTELALRYFRSHGPATIRDFTAWSSLTVADARLALEGAGGELDHDEDEAGKLWYAAPVQHKASSTGLAGAFLIPMYDETIVAYQDLRVVLAHPPPRAGLLDRAIVVDGYTLGSWRRTLAPRSATLEATLFRSLSGAEAGALDDAVERFARFRPAGLTRGGLKPAFRCCRAGNEPGAGCRRGGPRSSLEGRTMRRRGRTASVGSAIAVLGLLIAGGVIAAGRSSDEGALQPTRQPASQGIERKVENLLRKMTVDEKLQQLQLLSDGQITDEDARAGVGSVFSLTDPAKINHFQQIAVNESRLHIPILFAYDTIHGYRTIFPIPLAAASSFDPSVATADNTISARETATAGIKQIYAPMVDVSHEPRWGRISEAAGEDPYLGAVFSAARVKAAQGADYSAPEKVVASVKHFAAYGQPEGGREYNTTDLSEARLRNIYLPPFKAAIDAGADTVMCSFNAINGVPGCADYELETSMLKGEWGFDGFIESDYTAVAELRACPPRTPDEGPCGHGIAADGPAAAQAALNAGTDSEMVSTNIRDYGKQLLAQGKISKSRLDDAVRRILRVKFRAGLFDHPFVDQAKAVDAASFVTADDRAAARAAAGKSMVLLKNDGATLPLSPTKSVAVIGPLGNNQHDMLGPWWGQGRDADTVTVFDGIKAQNPNTTFTQGCTILDKEPPNNTPADECGSDAGFAAAVAAANAADQVVLALGESRGQSGEAASRIEIGLPGKQQELIDAIKATGKPFVVVLFNGRPLTLGSVAASSPAILEAWFPGTEAGNAVADVLFGKVNPGGKLPVSFPRALGQIPIYYNHEPTGRPCDTGSKWNARYRDLASCDPLYAFGFGLSYTTFSVTNLQLSTQRVAKSGKVVATVDVTNTGTREGDDVVQLYLHDPVASISQPVRRLRGFQRVTLAPGATQTVSFTLDKSDFGFYDNRGRFVVEPGTIDVYAGDSSAADLTQSFTVSG